MKCHFLHKQSHITINFIGFHLNLNGKRRLYVITEVVYATNTTIEVSVEGKEKKNEIKTKIPIAFSYTKFPISSSGIMKAAVDTKIKKSAKFAPADYA